MLRIKQLVPTVALTLATTTLVAPAVQARPADVVVGSSPQSLSTRAFSPVHRGPGPGLGDRGTGTVVGIDFHTNMVGRYVQGPIRSGAVDAIVPRPGRAVAGDYSGFDTWTAAVIGLITIMLVATVGVGIRTRPRLAT